MVDIASISAGLQLRGDGVWHSFASTDVSYRTLGHNTSFEIEDRSYWYRHRNRCILTLIHCFPPLADGPIFDIGGGNGCVSHALLRESFDVVLVEPGYEGVKNAKSRGIGHLVCASLEDAGFYEKSMPAIGLFDVVEHIEDHTGFMHRVHSLLEENGMLYLTVPAYSFLWSRFDETAGHYRRYTLGSILDLLVNTGFRIEFSTYIFSFLPLPIFLFRAVPFRLRTFLKQRSRDSVTRDHAAGSGNLGNWMLNRLAGEIYNIRRHKKIPFGGSCLVAARKVAVPPD